MKQGGVNWRKIKAEYIAGGISQRLLAEKYGVPPTTLYRRAKKEKWTTKRRAADDKAIEKTSEKVADIVADNAALCEQIKTVLLRKLYAMVQGYDINATEYKTVKPPPKGKKTGGAIVTNRIKDIAAALAILEEKAQKGQSAEIEDLTPLVALLQDDE